MRVEAGRCSAGTEQLAGGILSPGETVAPDVGQVSSQRELRSAASLEMSISFHALCNMCMPDLFKMHLVCFKY